MKRLDFIRFRKTLDKTQMELAHLMGISVKTIKSYEQGWRTIPLYAQREVLLLVSIKFEALAKREPCWVINDCPEDRKSACPAWEFNLGRLCWLVKGSVCNGGARKRWIYQTGHCKNCNAFPAILKNIR